MSGKGSEQLSCLAHAFKDTFQIFTLATPDHEEIGQSDNSEGNSAEVASASVEIVYPTWLSPELIN